MFLIRTHRERSIQHGFARLLSVHIRFVSQEIFCLFFPVSGKRPGDRGNRILDPLSFSGVPGMPAGQGTPHVCASDSARELEQFAWIAPNQGFLQVGIIGIDYLLHTI